MDLQRLDHLAVGAYASSFGLPSNLTLSKKCSVSLHGPLRIFAACWLGLQVSVDILIAGMQWVHFTSAIHGFCKLLTNIFLQYF